MKTRYIKAVVINTVNDVGEIDKRVNRVVEDIKNKDGTIVSIVPITYGLSPMNLIYNIIYERESAVD